MKTNREVVEECNDLARLFYSMQGCVVPVSYKMYRATHPAEEGCWNLAVAAYDHIEGTDVEDALTSLEE